MRMMIVSEISGPSPPRGVDTAECRSSSEVVSAAFVPTLHALAGPSPPVTTAPASFVWPEERDWSVATFVLRSGRCKTDGLPQQDYDTLRAVG
ncbi:hypothetical protein J6590_039230 [Homalodisca vitripennis]|nr:hypothetical protein J6590_039230 [Homalodisca vitripennis]